MKNKLTTTKLLSVVLVAFLITSCNTTKWNIPAEYVGNWSTGGQKITVRTHPKEGYQFTSDTAVVTIDITADKYVSGMIGLATFQNRALERNSGDPSITGVAYIVKCGRIGKIFEKDPLDSKEVEIWLHPMKENLEAELRYTEGLSVFPMGELTFTKR